ncbi:MAG TPA: DNA methyltransferase, partial [Salinarimonas sp.]|nr:DNA methyltransferase [Salinarimonas sp.]
MEVDLETFIARWTTGAGGAERANYVLFLTELCEVLGLPRPHPAGAQSRDYVFERPVRPREADGAGHPRRIDLYKRGCFILEAKQSRLPGQKNAIPGQLPLLPADETQLGRRSAGRGWDVMMLNARRQAEGYAFLLETDHPTPPFLITCDVGHAFELYADFTGTGRAYSQFPDRKGFRIYLEDLRDAEVRDRLVRVWTDPGSLDPARERARVTRAVAARLAGVTRALETEHRPQDVAHFLMRCIFTMFADDVDLIPKGEFIRLLERCVERPDAFAPLLEELWAKMDEKAHAKRFYSAFGTHLRHFNGNLFSDARAFALAREEVGALLAAARHRWTEVDPAIFGTLLEQALDPDERRRLGAHYTPRAYVQRLVEATVMEPLRADWQAALARAESAKEEGDRAKAVAAIDGFRRRLCATRVLDPACGTGNFLYVALELMKRLEGEVLEALAELGETERLALSGDTVDPHQFLGLELNPRAAAIAELVVWIGYLQQHYRTHTGHPAEPILQAFRNINGGRRDGYDAVLRSDETGSAARPGGRRTALSAVPQRPEWPDAEFIVGNPPFLGKGAAMRDPLGDAYVDALAVAHPHMNESADFVMYWWDRAAEILRRKGTVLRRFGFVTTNSISLVFNRRCVARHMAATPPLRIIYAVPDHPWTKVTRDAAAVRIAMTVASIEDRPGLLQEVIGEDALETDTPMIGLASRLGLINA